MLRISAGMPSAILLAELQHHDAVGDAHDQPHVVLDQQHGVAVVADRADQVHQVVLLGRVEAGGRLVEAQQLRVGGQRAGDLQPALVAVGQVAGAFSARSAMPTNSSSAMPRSIAVSLLAAVPRQPEQRAEHGLVRCRASSADHDVLERRHLAEQPDVLERAREAQPGDLVLLAGR